MSVQNNYNNYIKRQTQKSSNNNFKEKVANSLAGKTVNNTTTTITTPVGYGVIGTNTGVATTPSTSVSNTSVTQNNTVTPVTTSSVATNPSTLSRSIGARSTSSTSTSTKTSAIDKANELYQQQQDQLKKEWETQKAELEQQQKYYEDTYNQDKLEAENDYKKSEETLQDNRYKQMQDLAVSGQRRGIQYSPQQLALENNANINYNKNLTQLSQKRNELLNSLQIELDNNLAKIALGLQNVTNSYNGNMLDLEQSYIDRLNSINNNMFGLEESYMDRINSLNAGGTGSSKYSYGSSYTPYSYKSNYTPYTSNSKSRSYDNELELANALLSGDEDYENAYLKTFADNSSSISDELNVGTLNDVETKAEIYKEQVDGEIAYAKSVGASQRVIDEMEAVRDETLMNLYNQSYARSTNTPYQLGDTVYKSTTPVRQSYIDKTKSENGQRKYNYIKNNLFDENTGLPKNGSTVDWFKATNDRNALDLHNKIMNSSKNKTTKTNTSKKTTKPKTSIKVKVAKATTNKNVKKSVDNAKKNVSKAKTNAKKNVASAKSNVKKNVAKAKTNVKKNVASAKSNVKKNVSNSIKNAKKNTVKSTLSKFKTNISKSLKKLFK